MSLLAHVLSRSFETREAWLVDLQRFGDEAERTWKALRRARSERQQDQAEEAFQAMQAVEGVMETIRFGYAQSPVSEADQAAIAHILRHLGPDGAAGTGEG